MVKGERILLLSVLDFSQSDRGTTISHCDFDFNFIDSWAISFIHLLAICISSFEVLGPFALIGWLFFDVDYLKVQTDSLPDR